MITDDAWRYANQILTVIAILAQSFGTCLCSRSSANDDHSLLRIRIPFDHRLHHLGVLQLGLSGAHLHLSGVALDLKLVQAVQTGEVFDVARL